MHGLSHRTRPQVHGLLTRAAHLLRAALYEFEPHGYSGALGRLGPRRRLRASAISVSFILFTVVDLVDFRWTSARLTVGAKIFSFRSLRMQRSRVQETPHAKSVASMTIEGLSSLAK